MIDAVFACADRVALWVLDGRTPEGVGAGSSLREARRAYPSAQPLSDTAWLVAQTPCSYLIIHNGSAAIKIVAGSPEAVSALQDHHSKSL